MGSRQYHPGSDVDRKVAARIEADSTVPSPQPDEIRSYSAEQVMALEQGRQVGSVSSSQLGPAPSVKPGPTVDWSESERILASEKK